MNETPNTEKKMQSFKYRRELLAGARRAALHLPAQHQVTGRFLRLRCNSVANEYGGSRAPASLLPRFSFLCAAILTSAGLQLPAAHTSISITA